jgi:hypothetical protein
LEFNERLLGNDLRLAESAPCPQAANGTLRCGRTETGGVSEARNNISNETTNNKQHNQMGHADICPECIYVSGRMPQKSRAPATTATARAERSHGFALGESEHA